MWLMPLCFNTPCVQTVIEMVLATDMKQHVSTTAHFAAVFSVGNAAKGAASSGHSLMPGSGDSTADVRPARPPKDEVCA